MSANKEEFPNYLTDDYYNVRMSDGVACEDTRHVDVEEVRSRMKGNRIVEGSFAQDCTIASIDLPEELEDIGEVSFFGCLSLREIKLPKHLRFIREEAFGESGLESICIPENVELIAEKAFMDCQHLKHADVLGLQTTIEVDAFSVCPKLLEGFIARGYPERTIPPEELLYTLLWCTCPDRHLEQTCMRAKKYIADNETLVMEKILKQNNVAALSGVVAQNLLNLNNLHKYITRANKLGLSEITTILLDSSKGLGSQPSADNDPFSL